MTQNKIVDLVHVSFIQILLPQFLMYSLINMNFFGVGHFYVYLGTIGARVRDYC